MQPARSPFTTEPKTERSTPYALLLGIRFVSQKSYDVFLAEKGLTNEFHFPDMDNRVKSPLSRIKNAACNEPTYERKDYVPVHDAVLLRRRH